MDRKGEFSPDITPPRIKLRVIVPFVAMLLLLGGACSREEPQEPRATKIVMPIKMPPRKAGLPAARKETGKDESGVKSKVTSARKPANVSVEKEAHKEKAAGPGPGFYRVRKGDTLFKVAGQKEVYGDSLKWPSLFRLNMNQLTKMEPDERFQHKELLAGLNLRFVTPAEARDNVRKLGRKIWVINVLSSQSPKKIIPAAVRLTKKGYRVYISTVMVKGQEWIRLRAGFYDTRKRATAVGKDIMSMLHEDDAWVSKIGKMELQRFGGY